MRSQLEKRCSQIPSRRRECHRYTSTRTNFDKTLHAVPSVCQREVKIVCFDRGFQWTGAVQARLSPITIAVESQQSLSSLREKFGGWCYFIHTLADIARILTLGPMKLRSFVLVIFEAPRPDRSSADIYRVRTLPLLWFHTVLVLVQRTRVVSFRFGLFYFPLLLGLF